MLEIKGVLMFFGKDNWFTDIKDNKTLGLDIQGKKMMCWKYLKIITKKQQARSALSILEEIPYGSMIMQ